MSCIHPSFTDTHTAVRLIVQPLILALFSPHWQRFSIAAIYRLQCVAHCVDIPPTRPLYTCVASAWRACVGVLAFIPLSGAGQASCGTPVAAALRHQSSRAFARSTEQGLVEATLPIVWLWRLQQTCLQAPIATHTAMATRMVMHTVAWMMSTCTATAMVTSTATATLTCTAPMQLPTLAPSAVQCLQHWITWPTLAWMPAH